MTVIRSNNGASVSPLGYETSDTVEGFDLVRVGGGSAGRKKILLSQDEVADGA
jgi:hypothetical protein